MKAFKRLKKTFRSFLVFVMVFLISGSSLNFAFATYGILVPHDPGSQTVNVEHIWVDKNNQYTTETVEKEDGSKELVSNNPNPKDEDATPRPDKVEVDVIGTIGGEKPDPENPVQFKELNPGEKPEDVTFPDASTEPSPDDPTANNTKDVISDDGHTAGENAGKHDAEAGKENSGEKAGYDEGFNKGYQEGNPPAAGENPPAEGENPPAAGENPPAAGENPSTGNDWPQSQLPNLEGEEAEKVSDAIKDIISQLPAQENPNVPREDVTLPNPEENKDNVDLIAGKGDEGGALLGPRDPNDPNFSLKENDGNVWYESKDYVAQVEVKDGEDAPPVTYQVELSDDTKIALNNAGYDSVQLKQTVETVFAVRDDKDTMYVDPWTGHEIPEGESPVLAICKYVSYDNGQSWEMVGEPKFQRDGKDYDMTWQQFIGEQQYFNQGGKAMSQEDRDKIVESVQTYEADKDYVQETTYTFMHVLKEPEPVPNDPYNPSEPDDPETPEIPTQEVPEDPVPRVEPPEEEPLVDIPPEDVPLTTVPRTGDISSVWTMLALLSVTGLLGVTLLERKKANNS